MSEIDSKARDLFLQVLDQQPEAVVAFLDDACGGNAELRRRVQELLDAHKEAGNFLAPSEMEETNIQSAVASGPDGFTETTIRTNPESGTNIGPYKLLEQIGEGGMGTVWVASQSKPIKRKVAIKLIKAGMDSGQVLARFEAERQALAMMDHPNIARVLDGGMTEQGRPYFAMEYVKGVPLTEYCDSARLSLQERLELFVPVCHAVQHAHQKGIIHRDLKPSNILICLYDGKPVPKVIDFGLAKAMHHSLTEQSLYTAQGMMIGTPLYMSPEQAEQNNLDIDTRTDIYALGVILYELLTGTTPLEKAQMKQAAFNEVLRLIKEEEPPKPSTRLSCSDSLPSVAAQRSIEPANLTRSISGDLDWVVMKALEKERSRRYETANGLAEDIRRHLSDEPVSASPPSTGYRMRKFVRRNRGGVVAAIAIVVALLLGVVGTTSGMMWALAERKEAVDARKAETEAKRNAEENADSAKAEAARATKAEQLARNEALRAKKAEQRTAETLKQVEAERDAKEKARQDAEQMFDRLTRMFDIPESQLDYHNLNPVELLDRWAVNLESDFVGHPEQFMKSQAVLAKLYMFLKAYPQAIAIHKKLRDYHVANSGNDSIDTLRAFRELAYAYMMVRDREAHLRTLEDAYPISCEVLGPEDPKTLTLMNSMANEYEHAGRMNEALTLLEKALAISDRVNGESNLQSSIIVSNLARVRSNSGMKEKAIESYERAVNLGRELHGSEHFLTQKLSGDLLSHLQSAGRHEEATTFREEMLMLTGQALAAKESISSGEMDSYTNRAISIAAQQLWDGRAPEHAKLVQQLFEVVSQTEDHRALERVAKISSLAPSDDVDAKKKAIEFARKAVSMSEDDESFLPWANMALGMAEYRGGQFEQATETLTKTASLVAKVPNEYRTVIIQTADLYRAMALFEQEKPEQARDLVSAVRTNMRPLPGEGKDPFADGGNQDDLILWLAFKEANALINK